MKKLTTIFLLISFSTFAKKESVEDSLIANIGKKAKVIFYAENKADLNEIAKYDLNKLFAEVRKRSEKNFSNNEEVTLREVDENLKNREVNTTVSPKKWFKNMNLNVFTGISISESGETFFGLPKESTLPQYGKVQQIGSFTMSGTPSFMFGVGAFYEKQLYKRKRTDISLRYGLGIDLISSRLKTSVSSCLCGSSSIPNSIYNKLNDSLAKVNGFKDSPYKNYISPNLYTQITPTFNILNKKGNKIFSIGIGLKVAVNVSGVKNPSTGDVGLFTQEPNIIYPYYKRLQTAWLANIGYKYLNFFIQMKPIVGNTLLNLSPNSEGVPQVSNGKFSYYIVGLRFGK